MYYERQEGISFKASPCLFTIPLGIRQKWLILGFETTLVTFAIRNLVWAYKTEFSDIINVFPA